MRKLSRRWSSWPGRSLGGWEKDGYALHGVYLTESTKSCIQSKSWLIYPNCQRNKCTTALFPKRTMYNTLSKKHLKRSERMTNFYKWRHYTNDCMVKQTSVFVGQHCFYNSSPWSNKGEVKLRLQATFFLELYQLLSYQSILHIWINSIPQQWTI